MEKITKHRHLLTGQIITYTYSEELTKLAEEQKKSGKVHPKTALANERLSKLNAESLALIGLA